MPSYDYECKSCSYIFEVFQNMSDPLIKKCPRCSKGVRRLIGGGTGIIFKGSGFYVTDNKRGDNGSSSKTSDTSSSSDSKESTPKTESSGDKTKETVKK